MHRAYCRVCNKIRFINNIGFCFWCFDSRESKCYKEMKTLVSKYRDSSLRPLELNPNLDTKSFLKDLDIIIKKYFPPTINTTISHKSDGGPTNES